MLDAETYGASYGLIKKTMQGAGAIKGDKGDKGDRGEKGEKGDKGDTGENGLKGDRGYTGAKGEDGITPTFTVGSVQQGESAGATITGTAESPVLNLTLPKGDKGEKGDTGRDGKDGQNGSSFSIRSRFATEADLKTAFPTGPNNEGDAYFVGTGVSPDLYVWLADAEEWHNNGPIAGVKGDKGDTGDTGADGFSPVAQVTKSDGVTTISIRDKTGLTTESILDGEKGADGKSAYEVAVDEGFLGSESEWLDELKGEQGVQGMQGEQGEKGFSPTATVTQTSDGAIIEIEDENGRTSATVKNVTGELVPSVSKYQSGNKTSDTTSWSTGETGTFIIDLSENMPDTDYIVVPTLNVVGVSAIVHSKAVNSFKVTVRNDREETIAQAITLNWQAFKLMTDANLLADEEQITRNKEGIAEIKKKIPSGASASNQLVTESDISKTEKTLSIGGSASAIVKIDVSVPFIAASYGKFTEIDFQVRSDNIRFFISANDGTYLVTAQHNYRSSGWLTGLYYLVNDSKSISLYVGILNYPADVGAKLVFNGLDGAEITEISTVSALPSGYAAMKQFPVIYTADLTSSVTSGSTAPITAGGIYSTFQGQYATMNTSFPNYQSGFCKYVSIGAFIVGSGRIHVSEDTESSVEIVSGLPNNPTIIPVLIYSSTQDADLGYARYEAGSIIVSSLKAGHNRFSFCGLLINE